MSCAGRPSFPKSGLALVLVMLPMFAQSLQAPLPNVTEHDSWRKALQDHLQRRPRSEATDIYKFVHQSVFGPAHLIPDRANARAYLQAELQEMEAIPADDPLLESLGGRPSLVRVNLRPWLAKGGDPERLLDAMIITASKVKGDPTQMTLRLREAVRMVRDQGREEMAMQLGTLAEVQGRKGFEALHHSEAYRAAYHPAYRVLFADLCRGLVKK